MGEKISKALLKFSPFILTCAIGILTKLCENIEHKDMVDEITKGVLEGLKNK